jgi:LmbE family N-acetylglucosaminyl deacetylase
LVENRLRSRLLSRSRWRDARWLVLAPHADDETLGCGALIYETAKAGRLSGVAFLTDGSGSHPCETASAKRQLIARRQQEARAALRHLAPSVQRPIFLAWPDANPHAGSARARAATVARLAAFCRTERVSAIAVTGRDEPHCDHVAAFEVVDQVSKTASRPIAVFEYVVWAKHPPGPDFAVVRTASMPLGGRNVALAQHRSQLTPALGDGFRVPGPMLRMPASDLLYTQGPR